MRAVIVGAGMGGLMTALALRQSGVFASVEVYEQTKVPSTAGAGLNVPPNAARICRWLGVDLDGGDPKGPDGAIDGGAGGHPGVDPAVARTIPGSTRTTPARSARC